MTEYVHARLCPSLPRSPRLINSCRVTYNTDYADAKRATINMIHDNMDLTVSADVRIIASSVETAL
jgi:hypothetical protein